MSQGSEPTILVTGGTGFLGRALVESLLEHGHYVRVLGRRPVVRWRQHPRVEHIRADINDEGVIERAIAGVRQIYHLAAATEGDWESYRSTTVQSLAHLLERFAEQGGGRFLLVSSLYNYDGGSMEAGIVIDESFPLEQNQQGRGYYALAKTEADRIAKEYLEHPTIQLTIVRPGIIYGPGMKNPVTGAALSLRRKLWIVPGDGTKPIPFVYLDDVVAGLVTLMESARSIGRVYNLLHPEMPTQNEYLALYRRWSGDRTPTLRVPVDRLLPLLQLADRAMRRLRGSDRQWAYKAERLVKHVRYSSQRLADEVGFVAETPLAEGMRQSWSN